MKKKKKKKNQTHIKFLDTQTQHVWTHWQLSWAWISLVPWYVRPRWLVWSGLAGLSPLLPFTRVNQNEILIKREIKTKTRRIAKFKFINLTFSFQFQVKVVSQFTLTKGHTNFHKPKSPTVFENPKIIGVRKLSFHKSKQTNNYHSINSPMIPNYFRRRVLLQQKRRDAFRSC